MAIELVAEPRSELGKQQCKQLREAGRLPGNIYGGDFETPKPISFAMHETDLLLKANGRDADYAVVLEGTTYPVVLKEAKTEPIYKKFLHLDFMVRSDG